MLQKLPTSSGSEDFSINSSGLSLRFSEPFQFPRDVECVRKEKGKLRESFLRLANYISIKERFGSTPLLSG